MITLKLNQVFSCIDALKELAEQDIPLPVSFSLAKALKIIDAELITFNDTRTKRAKELGKKDYAGELIVTNEQIEFEPENALIFQNEMAALMAAEHNIDIEKISIESLGKINMKPKNLMPLDWLFVE